MSHWCAIADVKITLSEDPEETDMEIRDLLDEALTDKSRGLLID